MKKSSNTAPMAALALATMALLAACGIGSEPAGQAPASQGPSNAAPGNATSGPKLTAFSAEALGAAEWTRQKCDLNSVNDTWVDFTADRSKPAVFRGFVIDETGGVTPDFKLVLKSGAAVFAVPGSTGAARPDVAQSLGNPALEASGFEVAADLSALEPGTYQVFFVIERGEKAYFCESDDGVVLR